MTTHQSGGVLGSFEASDIVAQPTQRAKLRGPLRSSVFSA